MANSGREKMSTAAVKPVHAVDIREDDVPIRPVARLPYRASVPVRKIDEAVRRVIQKRLAQASENRIDARV